MKLIDVTLRDGGFTCDFNWPIEFTQEYFSVIEQLEVFCVELGYWKQTTKSKNRFFNLNEVEVNSLMRGHSLKCCVMIDYHYCSQKLDDYPIRNESPVSLIRMTCRKDLIKDGVVFAKNLKKHSGLEVAFNLFNTANYSEDELMFSLDKVLDSDFDIVGFADTHGSIDLYKESSKYLKSLNNINKSNSKSCFHLHNHSGKALSNYRFLKESNVVDYCDTSIKGLGKGAGNLKLEETLDDAPYILHEFIIKHYNSLFKRSIHPFYAITGKFGITDNYATNAIKYNLKIKDFYDMCTSISGLSKDNYDMNIVHNYL